MWEIICNLAQLLLTLKVARYGKRLGRHQWSFISPWFEACLDFEVVLRFDKERFEIYASVPWLYGQFKTITIALNMPLVEPSQLVRLYYTLSMYPGHNSIPLSQNCMISNLTTLSDSLNGALNTLISGVLAHLQYAHMNLVAGFCFAWLMVFRTFIDNRPAWQLSAKRFLPSW